MESDVRTLGQIWGKTVFGNSAEPVPTQSGISSQDAALTELKARFSRQIADGELHWGLEVASSNLAAPI